MVASYFMYEKVQEVLPDQVFGKYKFDTFGWVNKKELSLEGCSLLSCNVLVIRFLGTALDECAGKYLFLYW